MAYVSHDGIKSSRQAASDLPQYSIVTRAAEGQVARVGSQGQRPLGSIDVASLAQGQHVAVYEDGNVVKAKAAASLGVGADIYSAGSTSLLPAAAASGAAVWSVGVAESPAAAGEIFSLRVHVRQLSGLA